MPSRYTHAGGLVFRTAPGGPEYLVIEARRSRGTWVLPKGHIEDGETAEEAAVREVQEEAGSEARVVERLGRIELAGARVLFFLMRHRRDVPPDERRRLKWLTCEDAMKCVGFDDIRRLLKRAHSRLGNGWRGPRASTTIGRLPKLTKATKATHDRKGTKGLGPGRLQTRQPLARRKSKSP